MTHLGEPFPSAALSSGGSWPATLASFQSMSCLLRRFSLLFFWPPSAVKVFGRKLFGVRGNNS